MNQLFYNIAGGIVHQIRREKRTTISEVIVQVKRNVIKQNRNWHGFILNFLLKAWVLNLTISKRKNLSLPLKVETDQFVICLVLPVSFCQNFLHFTLEQWRESWRRWCFLSRCFSLFLPLLRTLAQDKRSEIVFVLGLVVGVSVSIHYGREISEYFSPR